MTTLPCLGSTTIKIATISDGDTRRSAERAATLAILADMAPDCSLTHLPNGAPRLCPDTAHISISHSRHLAAVALDPTRIIGIDIEEARPEQLQKVAARVLSEEELAEYADSLLQAWTLKEALYKCAGVDGADFRRDIHLPIGHIKNKATVATPEGGAMGFEILLSRAINVNGTDAWLSVVAYSLVP